MMYNAGMVCGVLVGLLIGIVLVLVMLKVTKKDGSIKCKYDERQSEVRGRAYKLGFFTFLLGSFCLAVLFAVVEHLPVDHSAALFLLIVISVAVQIVYCIWRDAYFSLNESRGRVLVAFVLLGVVNLLIGGYSIVSGTAVEDGVLTFRCANLLCGLLFLVIFVALLIRKMAGSREEE